MSSSTRTCAFVLAAAACAVLAGCTSSPPMGTASMGAPPAPAGATVRSSTPGGAGAAGQFTSADQAFAIQATGSGMYEVEVSRLALSRATMPQVRSYAQMLMEQHTAGNAELLAITRGKQLAMPTALPPDKQAKVARMATLSGAAFDREYVRVAGVEDHMATIALFEQGQRSVADADLRAFIAKTMPMLRAHLQQAQALAGQMAG